MKLLKTIIENNSLLIDKAKELHTQYEKYLPAGFFSLGFLIDIITLGEVDDTSNILMIGFYLVVCLFILATEYLELSQESLKNKWFVKAYDYRDDIFHFFLGALLSVFTLFYFKSGSLSSSFIFLLIMVSLLLLNEIQFFQRIGIVVRTSLVMLCLISFLIYIAPMLIGTTNSIVFYSCLVLSLLISFLSLLWLTKFNDKKEQNLKRLFLPQLGVVLLFGSLYLFKLIPPIPLSLKYIGIFHDVTKNESGYETSELKPWWNFWSNGDETFLARPGDKVFMFTRIFSPGGFSGKVNIHWLYDTENGFMTSDKIPLNITGGRDEGFRGYAYKSNFVPGDWQVRVETEEGLEIGRIYFQVLLDRSQNRREFRKMSR